ncbi:MarR family winged helix-turn-helix transcriptional regulator [Asticcacaulis sp. 201]|uniref:MarR family winged helix-turn-helix transcriptional regulator n=1 Tax=Asticcacaulis sp. 201 TaxID=3028787 RepID=UPI00291713E4|nr:MarR family winged helix-turn-helix transcriptional regulator [Asticcacaulis sp. 201]MDV6329918.1 MarR family winged helix-turn-helix transcriptional regulator [Asticcacaulis sp. 201]
MDDRPQRALDAIRRIVQAARLSSAQCERASGLTTAQLFILRYVSENDGVSINDLAAQSLTHQSTVSEVVGRLEAKAFLVRKTSATDGRRRELHVTEAGRAAATRPVATIQEILTKALRSLDSQSLDSLVMGLDNLIHAAGLDDQPAGMLMEESFPDASGPPLA